MRLHYAGPLRAVILGWAGTVIDFGARAPVDALVATFQSAGVAISVDDARMPMGLPKLEQIRAIGSLPEVAFRWEQAQGRPMNDADVESLFARYVPLNLQTATEHADLIPGAAETLAALRRRGLKIGSTTGYPRPVMDALAPLVARHGFRPDALVCAGDLAASRPTPLMCFKNMVELGVWPAAACVKVDDTVPGLQEGLNAGMWAVAVALTGNEMGLSQAELAALPSEELRRRRNAVYARLRAGGAHYVIDGISNLPLVLDAIESRLKAGESP